jgi:hypothetical protein
MMPRNWENKSAKLNRLKYVKLYLRLGIVSANLSLFFIVLRIYSAHYFLQAKLPSGMGRKADRGFH